MPHKRAKASIRKANSLSIGSDLPPNQPATKTKKRKRHGTSGDGNTKDPTSQIPKNMYRILNGEKIRADFKIRKQQLKEAGLSSTSSDQQKRLKVEPATVAKSKPKLKGSSYSQRTDELKLLPDETLGAFNRRVETALRPKLTAVLKAARLKTDEKDVTRSSPGKGPGTDKEFTPMQSSSQKRPGRATEFAPRPSKFPLADVVMEPPTLSLSKPMKKIAATKSNTPLPISGAQKRMIEEERERVIKRYRQMKEEKHSQVA